MPITSDTFRRACSKFATGITIATTKAIDGHPHGFTANSFTSVSLDPPLVLLCIDWRASIVEHFREAEWYAVHILRESQRDLSHRFATRGSDRFEGVPYTQGPHGVPLLPDVLATLFCRRQELTKAGDHLILLGEVQEASFDEGDPLLYYDSGYRSLTGKLEAARLRRDSE